MKNNWLYRTIGSKINEKLIYTKISTITAGTEKRLEHSDSVSYVDNICDVRANGSADIARYSMQYSNNSDR